MRKDVSVFAPNDLQKFTLPKNKRLLKSSEFSAIKGTRLTASSNYVLLLAKSNALPHPRLGLAIAKRQVKLAVTRNRIKRIARESFRHNSHLLPNIDIIMLVRNQINKIDSKELHLCLASLWKQLADRAKKF